MSKYSYIIGKVGTMVPEKISNDLSDVCEMLAEKIRDDSNS